MSQFFFSYWIAIEKCFSVLERISLTSYKGMIIHGAFRVQMKIQKIRF